MPASCIVGCAEVHFRVSRDARLPPTSLLLEVRLRNHCTYSAPFDASALRLTGYDASESPRPVALYDPRGEIHAMDMDAEAEGTEHIRLDGLGSLAHLGRLCVDVSDVSDDARRTHPAPMCLDIAEGPAGISEEGMR
jgi:hypothetical protein